MATKETPQKVDLLKAFQKKVEELKVECESITTEHGDTEDAITNVEDALDEAIEALNQTIKVAESEDEDSDDDSD